MATGKPFREVELPQQKVHDDDVLFPVVLTPNNSIDSTIVEVSSFEDAIRAHKPWLESLLLKSGAIIFRGFPVKSPSDFKSVIEAFGYPEFPYVAGVAPRTKVVERVYTTNESPLDKEIPFHHEMAYLPVLPTKLFFFCEQEPEAGGETPIVLSHIVYERMKERHPNFVAKLVEHGLRYIKIVGDDDDPSFYTGHSWKSAFKTDDKNIAQERAAKQGIKLEWMGNTAKVTSSPLAAIWFDEESCQKTWFNSLTVSYVGPATEKFGNRDTSVNLGNGEPMDDDAVRDL